VKSREIDIWQVALLQEFGNESSAASEATMGEGARWREGGTQGDAGSRLVAKLERVQRLEGHQLTHDLQVFPAVPRDCQKPS